MKVLVATARPELQLLLQEALSRWKFEPVFAADGDQAWLMLTAANAPSMAILDFSSPEIGANELCRRVREQDRQSYTYIILLMPNDSGPETIQALEAGADDRIVTPLDEHELQVRLRAGRRIVQLQDDLVRARDTLRRKANPDSLST